MLSTCELLPPLGHKALGTPQSISNRGLLEAFLSQMDGTKSILIPRLLCWSLAEKRITPSPSRRWVQILDLSLPDLLKRLFGHRRSEGLEPVKSRAKEMQAQKSLPCDLVSWRGGL